VIRANKTNQTTPVRAFKGEHGDTCGSRRPRFASARPTPSATASARSSLPDVHPATPLMSTVARGGLVPGNRGRFERRPRVPPAHGPIPCRASSARSRRRLRSAHGNRLAAGARRRPTPDDMRSDDGRFSAAHLQVLASGRAGPHLLGARGLRGNEPGHLRNPRPERCARPMGQHRSLCDVQRARARFRRESAHLHPGRARHLRWRIARAEHERPCLRCPELRAARLQFSCPSTPMVRRRALR
jgi:hypothetical protein